MAFTFEPLGIRDVVLVRPERHLDDRGFFRIPGAESRAARSEEQDREQEARLEKGVHRDRAYLGRPPYFRHSVSRASRSSGSDSARAASQI